MVIKRNGNGGVNVRYPTIWISLILLIVVLSGVAVGQGRYLNKIENNANTIKNLEEQAQSCSQNIAVMTTQLDAMSEDLKEIKADIKNLG